MVEDKAVEDEADDEVQVDVAAHAAEHNTENAVELTVNLEAEFIPNSNDMVAGIQDKNAVKCTQMRPLMYSK